MATEGKKPLKALSPEESASLLDNWIRLNQDIMGLPFQAVKQLLEAEAKGRRRPQVLLRLYGRYNKLREHTERFELMKDGTLPWEEK